MGKSAKGIVTVLAIVLVLIGVRIAVGLANRPDDQKLIQTALQEAIEASKEGRPGGVVDLLSSNLKVNNMDVQGNRGQIVRFIRDNKPNVDVKNKRAIITGDEARIVSPVELSLPIIGGRTLKEVTMIFRKEDAMEYLVFPTRKWRLTEVRVPEGTLADLTQ